MVGASEVYEARCRHCHEVPGRPDAPTAELALPLRSTRTMLLSSLEFVFPPNVDRESPAQTLRIWAGLLCPYVLMLLVRHATIIPARMIQEKPTRTPQGV